MEQLGFEQADLALGQGVVVGSPTEPTDGSMPASGRRPCVLDLGDHRAQERAQTKAEQAEPVLSRYREPLLAAAHNLQARTYNIVDMAFLKVYLHCGDPEVERYAKDYTVYVLAEYLCWAEIIRRDLRFLDLGSEERNRDLIRLLRPVSALCPTRGSHGRFAFFGGSNGQSAN